MTTTRDLAAFVDETDYDRLSADVRDALRRHVLDALGVAIAAGRADPPGTVFRTVRDLEAGGPCALWGRDGGAGPAGATMHNAALIGHLEFQDAFLAPGETARPSDSLAGLLAVGEYAERSGTDLLAALAIAYELQGELAWNAPLREKGFDHATYTTVATAAGAAKLLDLSREEIREALAIAVTGHNALRATRTGEITSWHALAGANGARNGVFAALLASRGADGPSEPIDGQRGWADAVAGPFELEPSAGERVLDASIKRYAAEPAAQSAVEAVIELAEAEDLEPTAVSEVRLETFSGAKRTLAGGEGDRHAVETREQALYSLPYALAVSLVDRECGLAQYDPERIRRADVQSILESVTVTEDPDLTDRFEAGELPAVVDVTVEDGTTYRIEKETYRGHASKPLDWAAVERKFDAVTDAHLPGADRDALVEAVRSLENRDAADLSAHLA